MSETSCCYFGLHQWEKWIDSAYVIGQITLLTLPQNTTADHRSYDAIVQTRICHQCGMKQSRRVKL